jgi:hypothetical protein
MLAPATGFLWHSQSQQKEVRLAYVLNLKAIDAAMDCLEKALEEYQKVMEEDVVHEKPRKHRKFSANSVRLLSITLSFP